MSGKWMTRNTGFFNKCSVFEITILKMWRFRRCSRGVECLLERGLRALNYVVIPAMLIRKHVRIAVCSLALHLHIRRVAGRLVIMRVTCFFRKSVLAWFKVTAYEWRYWIMLLAERRIKYYLRALNFARKD